MKRIQSVLLVDDNPDDNMIAKRTLLRAGLVADDEAVFTAQHGREALEFLQDFDAQRAQFGERFPPQLIFLDINMPMMDGFEFLEAYDELRAESDRYNSVVIMMLTSSQNAQDLERCKQYGSLRGYVSKPLDRHKVEYVLAELEQA